MLFQDVKKTSLTKTVFLGLLCVILSSISVVALQSYNKEHFLWNFSSRGYLLSSYMAQIDNSDVSPLQLNWNGGAVVVTMSYNMSGVPLELLKRSISVDDNIDDSFVTNDRDEAEKVKERNKKASLKEHLRIIKNRAADGDTEAIDILRRIIGDPTTTPPTPNVEIMRAHAEERKRQEEEARRVHIEAAQKAEQEEKQRKENDRKAEEKRKQQQFNDNNRSNAGGNPYGGNNAMYGGNIGIGGNNAMYGGGIGIGGNNAMYGGNGMPIGGIGMGGNGMYNGGIGMGGNGMFGGIPVNNNQMNMAGFNGNLGNNGIGMTDINNGLNANSNGGGMGNQLYQGGRYLRDK